MHQRQPMVHSEQPLYPFQMVSSDLFHHDGNNYLVIVDHYSKWYQVKQLRSLTSREVISNCDELFSSFGMPQIFRSDNGTQYTSAEFKQYCSRNNISHVTSSPGYPKSNGMAEAYVKIAKALVEKSQGQSWELESS